MLQNYLMYKFIKRAVKNIILTNKYERPFNSDFGCNLRGVLI